MVKCYENSVYENYIKGIMGAFIEGKEDDCKEHNTKAEK